MAVSLLVWTTLLSLTCIGMSSDKNWVRKNLMVMEQSKIIFICVLIIYMLILVLVSLLFIAEYGIKTEFIVKSKMRSHNKTFKKVAPKLYAIAT
jgi:hypothetical protein